MAELENHEQAKIKHEFTDDFDLITNLVDKIRFWAIERELDKADPVKQLAKLMEETGELAEGLLKDRKHQVLDSIGDIVVVLTILSLQLNVPIEKCISMAYEEIKDRNGKTVNGIYIKEEDLKGD